MRIITELFKNLQAMHVGNNKAICAQFSQIVPFVFKDRLYSCLSNFSISMQSQGDSNTNQVSDQIDD
jgi:hypothetical protein